jgi:hypothetical protein
MAARFKGNLQAYSQARATYLTGLKDRVDAGTTTRRDRIYVSQNRSLLDVAKERKAAKAQHSDIQTDQEFIAHFGRKGMKWGEHVFGNRGGGSTTVHPDVARARAAQAIIRTHGLHALSNTDLQALNRRSQLETDYARLNSHTSEGKKIVQQIAKEQSKAIATGYVAKYAPQGIEWIVRNGIKIAVGSGRHTKF